MSEADHVLEARGLTRRFAGFTAVGDVDLSVRRHSIHALIGPNGAGKTTCFNLLTKFLEPSAGRIQFEGVDITKSSPAAVARMGLVRSFQISAVFPHMTSLENVRIALQAKEEHKAAFWRSERVLSHLDAPAAELLDQVGLGSYRDVAAAELSYGRKRALEIATTLAANPKLLLLDEPTSGLGHEDVDLIADLILAAAKDRTILMVEHNLGVVAKLAHTITVLARGEVLAEGSYSAVANDPRVIEAYLGTGHG